MRGLTFYVGQKSFSAIIFIFGNVPHPSDLGGESGGMGQAQCLDFVFFRYVMLNMSFVHKCSEKWAFSVYESFYQCG